MARKTMNWFRKIRQLWAKGPPQPTAYAVRRPDGSFDAPFVENWIVLGSDVAARMYRNDMQLLFDHGVGGALRGIKGTIEGAAWREKTAKTSDERVRAMAMQSILEPIKQELVNVLTLSVQGHFEKAFRRWLRSSLPFSGAEGITDDNIIKAQWSHPTRLNRDLSRIMGRVRGVELSATTEGALLIELALVGNVVRHGDGVSARAAFEAHPELFPTIQLEGFPPPDNEFLAERLLIPEERLALYAQAAYQFWHRVQFAYVGEY